MTETGAAFDRIHNAVQTVSQIQEYQCSTADAAGTEQVVQAIEVISGIASTSADSTQTVAVGKNNRPQWKKFQPLQLRFPKWPSNYKTQ